MAVIGYPAPHGPRPHDYPITSLELVWRQKRSSRTKAVEGVRTENPSSLSVYSQSVVCKHPLSKQSNGILALFSRLPFCTMRSQDNALAWLSALMFCVLVSGLHLLPCLLSLCSFCVRARTGVRETERNGRIVLPSFFCGHKESNKNQQHG